VSTTSPGHATDHAFGSLRFARIGAGLMVVGPAVAAIGFLSSTGDERLTLSDVSGAAALGGIAVAVLGVLAILFARPLGRLYAPGRHLTWQRRIIQVGVPAAAFIVVLAIAATIANANR
jgi:hypothetical protein